MTDPLAEAIAHFEDLAMPGNRNSGRDTVRHAKTLVEAARAAPVLRGIGRITGDGWKDTTKVGEVVFVWNQMLQPPYAAGQYPRIGNEIWSASTEQYDFTPATAEEVRELFSARPVEAARAMQPGTDWFKGEVACAGEPLTTIPTHEYNRLVTDCEKFRDQVRDTCARAEKAEAQLGAMQPADDLVEQMKAAWKKDHQCADHDVVLACYAHAILPIVLALLAGERRKSEALAEALEHILNGALIMPRFAEHEARAALAAHRGETP